MFFQIIGLPIAYYLSENQNEYTNESLFDHPYENFVLEDKFDADDVKLSQLIMTYFTNFIKNG